MNSHDEHHKNRVCELFYEFSSYDTHNQFQKVKEKLSENKQMCALLKIHHISPELNLRGGHDTIYIGIPDRDWVKILDSDVEYLSRCGVRFDLDADCLAMLT